MRSPIALQLHSVRKEAAADFADVLEWTAAVGFHGVETTVLHGMPAQEFRRRLDDLGLRHTSACVSVGDEFEQTLDEQRSIGNDTIISGFTPERFASADAIKKSADEYNQAAALARDRGMQLGYHNHWYEFTPLPDGLVPMEMFLDHLAEDIFLEVDIYWLQSSGLDPVSTISSLGHRVRQLHVKDGPCNPGEPHVAVGTGEVDVAGILAAAPHVDWHLVEFDECATDIFEAVEASYRYLTEQGFSEGGKR